MELKITPSGQTIVKPTALGPGANTDTKLLIYGLFQKGRVLAQDGRRSRSCSRKKSTKRWGCRSYERAEDRRGYRNGAETRRVTTSVGTRELRVPRARVRDEETGETTEFRSELLPRYARRTREVDEAILGTYLSGANSRRIRKALKPLLGEEHLSKSAVSRVVSRLKECFEEWQNRDLVLPARAASWKSSLQSLRSVVETGRRLQLRHPGPVDLAVTLKARVLAR